jgi:very-short-patch-repair endonuclease
MPMRTGQKRDAARRLRAEPTEAEKRLRRHLRERQLDGYRFRRQVPIGPFVADFACTDRALIIELDGGQHDWREEQDQRRTAQLEAHGWHVLRFWNNDVMENIEGVLERIRKELAKLSNSPHPVPPPQAGEGDSDSGH